MKRGAVKRGALAAASLAIAGTIVALTATSAAAADARPAALCIPIILPCAPSPTPTPSDSSGTPLIPGLPIPSVPAPGASTPAVPGVPAPTPSGTVPPSVPDNGAPVFTQPPAQLGASSLSLTGIPTISFVTVPMADGSRVPVIKLTADSITIDRFALTVRHATGPKLATTADRMTLSGHVVVYLNSLTATTSLGAPLTLGADTPPPADGIDPGLLRVTLGLVGTTADSIVYTNTNQHLSE